MNMFRLTVDKANQFDLLHPMDTKTDFSMVSKHIKRISFYLEVPAVIIAKDNQVCKFNKTQYYALKRSSRCWCERFDLILKNMGLET